MRKLALYLCFISTLFFAGEGGVCTQSEEVYHGRDFPKGHRCKKKKKCCKRACRSYMPWWSDDPRIRLLGYYDVYYDYNNPYPWYGPVPVSFSLDCCL